MKNINLLIFCIISFYTFNSYASAINLTCKDKRTYGFRIDSPLPPEWGDKNFGNTWNIIYDGISDSAEIDGKKVVAVRGNGTVILIDYSANPNSQSLWSYAIHLKQKMVTAAQVNVYDLMGVGIKSRSVEFVCN